MTRPARIFFFLGLLILFAIAGCGSGSSSSTHPAIPTFTSVPVTAADEAAPYSYQLAATSPAGGTVTFSLTQSPVGASLTGSTLSWTPTHAQSRAANQFEVTAIDSSGGSATQSWSVTPTGVIVISAVFTYWSSSGSTTQPLIFPPGFPFPAALVPQSDGSFLRLLGSVNPDGNFGISRVPAGYFWLNFSPNANFWTSSSNFDAGRDVVGAEPPPPSAAIATTTIAATLTGADPIQQGDIFTTSSDVDFAPLPSAIGV